LETWELLAVALEVRVLTLVDQMFQTKEMLGGQELTRERRYKTVAAAAVVRRLLAVMGLPRRAVLVVLALPIP
jgi:hypothetical protein